MIGYRVTGIALAARWQDAFSGVGSQKYGGRWSSVGTRMVYASTHLSLATLEVLVHVNKKSFVDSRVAIRFQVDDDLVMTLDEKHLPEAWDALPAPVSSQQSGDAWIKSRASMGLLVPTAVLPDRIRIEERNLLLNPEFPDFLDRIQNPEVISFSFDDRITGLVARKH